MKKMNALLLGSFCAATILAVGMSALSAAPADGASDGKQIYERICQGCHMPDAKGATGAGKYPALAGDPALASRQFMALTLINGRRNMPAFGAKHAFGFGGPGASLTTAEIAAVINYVRSNFGNHFTDAITAEEVAALDQPAK
jgi:mono/diheme cytochrome c family protein